MGQILLLKFQYLIELKLQLHEHSLSWTILTKENVIQHIFHKGQYNKGLGPYPKSHGNEKEDVETKSLILSRMEHHSTWAICTNGSLKVK